VCICYSVVKIIQYVVKSVAFSGIFYRFNFYITLNFFYSMFYNFNYIVHIYILVTFNHLLIFQNDILVYHCCVYSEELLMMDKRIV